MTTEQKVYEAVAKTLVGSTTSQVTFLTAVEEAKDKVKVDMSEPEVVKLEVPSGWANSTKNRIKRLVSKAVPLGTEVIVA